MAKLLPLILALVGLLGGLGAGIALQPAPAPEEEITADADGDVPVVAEIPIMEPGEFVPMSNHFVIPLVESGRVRALVVLSLSLEVDAGNAATVRSMEPKLRDLFLQVLFDHANAGGFSGAFTAASPMNSLREALREAAASVIGPSLREILIVDIIRQDS